MKIKVKDGVRSFFKASEKGSENIYLVLLCLFIVSKMIYMVGWQENLSDVIWKIHQAFFTAVMWGSAIYLFSIMADWRKAWNRTGELIIIGITVFALAGIVSKLVTTDSYAFVMGVFFCLMAGGKDYKKILYCFLALLIATLVIGLIGLKAGITFDAAKPNREFGGHSLGILYPNNWGFLVFAVMIIVWYLYLKNRKVITLAFFWGVGIFMIRYITCYTIAGMALLFPIFAIIAELFEKRKSSILSKQAFKCVIVSLPFIALALMLILCWQMDWVYSTFYKYYGTSLRSFAMRFVEGGYALRLNGVSLFGHPFKQYDGSLVVYADEIEMIIDSAFICYLIIRGIIAMAMTLGWIAFAHHRSLKNRDYRLIAISIFMLLLSSMERPGLDVWYNFVFLYPLAKIVCGDEGMILSSS